MDSMVVGVGIKTRYLLKAVEVGYRRGSIEGTKFFPRFECAERKAVHSGNAKRQTRVQVPQNCTKQVQQLAMAD